MNRRDILKQLAIISGGIMLVPSCDFSKNDIIQAYENLKVTNNDKAILQKLCNTIIPSDSTHPGAEELAISDFVLVMMDDCYGSDDQNNFMGGLQKFDKYSKEQTRQKFQKLSVEPSTELVRNILNQPNVESVNNEDQAETDFEQIRYLVDTTKSLTIQGYMASEYIMTEVMPYKMLPGEFHGKVLIQENEKVNIND